VGTTHTPFAPSRVHQRAGPPPRLLVFGIMSDKDIADVATGLFPLFDAVIATEPYPPRSAPAAQLVAIAVGMSIEAMAEPVPSRAIERALTSGYRSIVVAGSLYLAGAAIEFLDAHEGKQREINDTREPTPLQPQCGGGRSEA